MAEIGQDMDAGEMIEIVDQPGYLDQQQRPCGEDGGGQIEGEGPAMAEQEAAVSPRGKNRRLVLGGVHVQSLGRFGEKGIIERS